MRVRSSPEGYSDVTEGNIFLLLPGTACSIRFITWPASYLDDLLIYLLSGDVLSKFTIYVQYLLFFRRRFTYLLVFPTTPYPFVL